jgi:hypothetical protein
MGLRVVHVIDGECGLSVTKTHKGYVTIRVTENPNEESCPSELADFEIEGSIPALRELFGTLQTVLGHIDTMSEEIN